MNARLMICTTLVTLCMSFNVVAGCGSCGGDSGCGSGDGCGWNYERGSSSCSDCSCTDPGWKQNTCVSKSTYCEAFGNLGAMEDGADWQ